MTHHQDLRKGNYFLNCFIIMLQKHTDQQKMVFPTSAQSLNVYFNDLTMKVLVKTHQIFFMQH